MHLLNPFQNGKLKTKNILPKNTAPEKSLTDVGRR